MWSTRRLIDRHRPNSASTSACTRYQLWRHNTAAARVCKSNGEGMHASEISTTRLERKFETFEFSPPGTRKIPRRDNWSTFHDRNVGRVCRAWSEITQGSRDKNSGDGCVPMHCTSKNVCKVSFFLACQLQTWPTKGARETWQPDLSRHLSLNIVPVIVARVVWRKNFRIQSFVYWSHRGPILSPLRWIFIIYFIHLYV